MVAQCVGGMEAQIAGLVQAIQQLRATVDGQQALLVNLQIAQQQQAAAQTAQAPPPSSARPQMSAGQARGLPRG